MYAAAETLRRPVSSVLDFSASINPLGPSRAVKRILADAVPLIHHYPDPDCSHLRRVLADRFGLSADHFVVGNGSTELIDLLPRVLSIRSAVVVGPTFSEYVSAIERAGGHSTMLLAARAEGYRPPLDRVMARLRSRGRTGQSFDALFLCQPNSPTGQACDRTGLLSLLKIADRIGVWVILDETFVEYCEDRSSMPVLKEFPRLVVLRSFTKFYSLPGLRIGYSVSSRQTAERIRRFQPPWSVNMLAQRAAAVSLQDHRYRTRSRAFIVEERSRLAARLAGLTGITVFESHANFLLIELPASHRADRVTAALRRNGVLVRDCSSVPGLNARAIRLAVRTKRENDKLVRLFRRVLREAHHEAVKTELY